MTQKKKVWTGLAVAAAALLLVGLFIVQQPKTTQVAIGPDQGQDLPTTLPEVTLPETSTLPDESTVGVENGSGESPARPTGPTMGKVAVNIDGDIEEVIEDGKKFRIGDLWVIITDQTELGITGPAAAPKEEQYFEDTFRVGNSISGFTLDDLATGEVTAYAIYNNYNWDEDIKNLYTKPEN